MAEARADGRSGAGVTREDDDWKHARDLFDRAVDEPHDKREEFVNAEAGGDDDLRRMVLSLVEQYDSRDPAVDGDLASFFESTGGELPDRWVGTHIGPYTVTRRVGRGGMGAVYEAQRDDDQYHQRVAVKLIRPGMDGDAIVRRFRRERQILATLEHPNIARLLDGGVAQDDRPFLVMEYVDGQPIDRYCDDLLYTVRQRIALFIEVCSAVEYAHRNLVVHRDLKPGNILVTSAGVPKLLDFGVAKLLHEGNEDRQPATTIDGRFLTPEYASPEQIRDEPVTTVSDVYSLGLILYELLAGHQPFRSAVRSALQLDRLLSAEPSRPSAVITAEAAMLRSEQNAPRLSRRLAGELDNIVLKAIRKEPSRRYSSVQSLADDLHRYLDGKPVLAQKDTLRYRTRKFVALHKAGVAAAVIVVFSLVGGMTVSLVQARRARAALVHADAERNKSEQVVAFLENMIGAGNRSWGSLRTRPNAKTTVLEALNQVSGSVQAELRDNPDAQATIRRTIGNTYQMMGLADSAAPHLRAALDLRRRVASVPNLDMARDLVGLAANRTYFGNYREALALLREALAIHTSTGDTTSIHYAVAINDLSVLLARSGDFTGGERAASKAVALHRALGGNSAASVATALGNLAFFRYATGDIEGSARFGSEALAIYDRPENRDLTERGPALFNMGMVRKWQAHYRDADSLFGAAQEVFGRTTPQHLYRMLTSVERGYTFYLSGNLDDAERVLREARRFAAQTHIPASHPEIARLATIEGLVMIGRGRAAQAELILREALKNRRSAHGGTDHRTMETMAALGLALKRLRRDKEATSLLATAHSQLANKFGSSDPRTQLVNRWRLEAAR